MKVGITTIKNMIDSGSGRDYAMFLYLKSICKKNCFYNYTQVGFSNYAEVSRSAVSKYVKRFLSRGWCVVHSGNLIFKGLKHYRTKQFNKHFIVKGKAKEILKQFYLILIKNKINQFEKIKQVSGDVKTPRNLNTLKYAKAFKCKYHKSFRNAPQGNSMFKISGIGLGKLFNCSASKGTQVMRELEKDNLIAVNREVYFVRNTADGSYGNYALGEGYFFNKNKTSVYKRHCNSYLLVA
jgi:hypothetical protein